MENTDIAPSVTIDTSSFAMPSTIADPVNAILLSFFACLAILITYLPLRSFYRVKNIAACSIMVVIIIVNLMTLINGILWPTDDWTKWWPGYGLCDVEALLRFPIGMALATSLCCLSKGLADALDTEHAVFNPGKSLRRRKMVGDVLFCWLVPGLQMCLHYTVQAGRYMIIPVWGCADQLDNSWPMIVIIIVWCPVFTLMNVYYAALMLIRLYRHRRTISAALTTTGSGLSPRKFIKLVLISLLFIIVYLPVQTLFIFWATPTTLVPYSWSRVHNPITWSPILFIHTGARPSQQYAGWAGVAMSAIMFTFFGFNNDAVDTYRGILVKLGAGWVWPSLRLTREQRRASETADESTLMSRGSFKSQFDLVGKAMKYFDAGSRKDSHATGFTLVDGSSTTSHKGSQGTFSNTTITSNLSHVASSPSNAQTSPSLHRKLSHQASTGTPLFSHYQHFDDDLEITSAPSRKGESNSFPTILAYPHPPNSTTPLQSSLHRGLFSVFRTHLNLPFEIFNSSASKTKSSKPQSRNAEMGVVDSRAIFPDSDIEAQNTNTPSFRNSDWPRCTSSIPSHAKITISTNIWSSPSSNINTNMNMNTTPINTNSRTDTTTLPAQPRTISMNAEEDGEIESIDPDSLKMGTRAYRERERQRHEFTSSSSSHHISPPPPMSISTPISAEEKKKNLQDLEHFRIYADNVHQEVGMNILSVHARNTGDHVREGLGGVLVRRSLEFKEERAD